MTSRRSSDEASTAGINKCYLFWNVFAISLGFMQFGVGMASWSNTQDAWSRYFQWSPDDATFWGDVLQSINIAGAAIGALSCSSLLNKSRLQVLLMLNLILCVGVGISLIGLHIYIMAIGRFLWGIGYGAFSVLCAKFVNEITPIELLGPYGAMTSVSLTLGAAIPCTFALAYPTDISNEDYPQYDFWTQQYFRITWSVPLLISFVQVLLITCVFRNESPVYLKEQNREEEIVRVFNKFYQPFEV